LSSKPHRKRNGSAIKCNLTKTGIKNQNFSLLRPSLDTRLANIQTFIDGLRLACQPMRRLAEKRWAIAAQFQNEYDGTLRHDIYSSTLIPCTQPFDLLENRIQ
jgi:hypothetical protein